MEKFQDFRFDKNIFKEMIGKQFIKYRCDEFIYTNSVTGVVGIFIGDKVFELRNEQMAIDYYNYFEDMAVWNIKECKESDIKSFFLGSKLIDTPMKETIKEIVLINENQKVTIDNVNYNVWLTRAIIFRLESRDVYFQKDFTAFSEEIEIKKGYNLLSEFPKYNDFFMEEWEDDIKPKINYDFVYIH